MVAQHAPDLVAQHVGLAVGRLAPQREVLARQVPLAFMQDGLTDHRPGEPAQAVRVQIVSGWHEAPAPT